MPTTFIARVYSMTVGFSATAIDNAMLPDENFFSSFTTDTTTTNPGGYRLEATGTASGTLGATCGGCANPLLDWTGTSTSPSEWSTQAGYFGITVRDADDGRLSKWGPAPSLGENDIVNNWYAGLSDSSPIVLHTHVGAATNNHVTMTVRARSATTTSATAHHETVSVTAIPLP